jgi:hypothetical protein
MIEKAILVAFAAITLSVFGSTFVKTMKDAGSRLVHKTSVEEIDRSHVKWIK